MRCAGCSSSGVEPLERQGQVGAALVAGDGVHLVEDDGLDPGERLAGLEVSIRYSDSGVVMRTSVRGPCEGPALAGGRVAGAHGDT